MPRRKDPDGLTDKQRLYVASYVGDGKAAALAAGYSGNTAQKSRRLMQDPIIAKAIEAKMNQLVSTKILTKTQILEQYSIHAMDTTLSMKDRLHALDSLSRTHGMFKDHLEGTVNHQMVLPSGLSVDDLRRLATMDTPMLVEGEIVGDDEDVD